MHKNGDEGTTLKISALNHTNPYVCIIFTCFSYHRIAVPLMFFFPHSQLNGPPPSPVVADLEVHHSRGGAKDQPEPIDWRNGCTKRLT